MSKSTVVEWLDENSQRNYPFTTNSDRFITISGAQFDLQPIVVDASIVVDEPTDVVKLYSISSDASDAYFEVDDIDFRIVDYKTATYPQYIRVGKSLLVVSEHIINFPLNTSVTLADCVFEASVVTEVFPSVTGLTSLNIVNDNDPAIVKTGEVILKDGYQLTLLPTSNGINIEVGRNEGLPLPCISVKPAIGTCPDGSDCCEVVSYINGATPSATGGVIHLVAGNHVKIYEDKDNHRIYIGYDFTAADIPEQILPKPAPVL